MFGKFFHVRPFVAQETKVNSWEFYATKQDIITMFVPNIKKLAPYVDLIQDLQ
jgi:hypothetical protein